ncbi:MAG: MMPL family transporter [Sulfurovum sp.]|nr:MMPL family transporter [Sulfurovum sp.]MCB4749700.1 MMPL family transporter [Sulfurovum sp.]MCB4762816.1 MMPL family transporter [Sulfurovum sp.]
MIHYINFLDRYKTKLFIIITIIVLFFSYWIKDIAFEGSYRIWFSPDATIMKNYDNFRDTFSTDDTFIVAFRDEKGIFTDKATDIVLKLTEEIANIDGVRKVDSLSNYQYISAIEDELNVEDFIHEDDKGDLTHKKEIALKDKLILNHAISRDGKTTTLSVKLSTETSSGEEVNIYVMDALEQIAHTYEQKYGYKLYISGMPAVTASLVTVAVHDAIYIMPLAVIIVIIFLWILFRDIVGVFVPAIIILYTFLIVLGMQFLMGYKLNNFTVNIPAFIAAIAIADSLHLLLAWRYYKSKKTVNKDAVCQAVKNNFLPITLTSFTTATGFASLMTSDIVPIATLGYAITVGAILAFVLSVTLAPALLLYMKDDYIPKRIFFIDFTKLQGYGKFITKHDKKIVGFFMILILVLGYGLKYVNVDNNSVEYFDKSTVVRSGSDFVEKYVTGAMTYEIIIDSKKKDGIKNIAFLKKVLAFEKTLKDKYPNVTFSTSIKDIIQRMHTVLSDTHETTLPTDSNLIAQYLLLYSMSIPQGMSINDQIDMSEQFLRMTINSETQTTSKDVQMIEWIKQWWKTHSHYSAQVEGETAIFSYMQEHVIHTLLVSILFTLIIIILAMSLIFKKLKMLWIFVLPNIAPIILVAGVMGYLGISIDIGVVISASVILGIAVDDTIHFFSKYFQTRKMMPFEESIDYIITHSGNAMILTTMILSFTFLIFAVSSFIPNNHFSFVTVIALNLALLLDLVLLPALLSLFYKKA